MKLPIIGEDKWYKVEKYADGISLIDEPWIKPFYRCNIWHIQGRDSDLLFDSGLGHFSLSKRFSVLRERPITCVASHTHFDHIGCHHEFSVRCVHCDEADIMASPDRERTLADKYADERMFDGIPEGWDSASYEVKPAPATRILNDGEVIDLGDRQFEVVHTPGHSPGGIALWESKTRTLLSGDIIYDGPLIDDTYHSDLGEYEESLDRLLKLPVETVHGGHFPSFDGARLKVVIDEYLRGRRKPGCHLS